MTNINTSLRRALQELEIMPGPSGMEYDVEDIIEPIMEATEYRWDLRAIKVALKRMGVTR